LDKDYEIKYHAEEEKNWWFFHEEMSFSDYWEQTNLPKFLILVVGRPLLLDLKVAGFTNVYGLDFSEAVEKCIERGLTNVYVMDGHYPKFNSETFDVIIASDSLEHLENEMQALHNWHIILKPAGVLIIFVPAFMYLWSDHDIVNHHYRRYTSGDLKRKVESEGFLVMKKSYWNFCMFFPTTFVRLIQKVKRFLSKQKKTQGQLPRLVHV
jgi:SAM-dependent methyltransferase